jgi:hypothetical protein
LVSLRAIIYCKWLNAMAEDEHPVIEKALVEAQDHVRIVDGCSPGESIEYGYCDGPDSEEICISAGCCFMVLTVMLPILTAATDGRVSPWRLWKLVMSRAYFQNKTGHLTAGVDYGCMTDYADEFPLVFGEDPYGTDLSDLEKLSSQQEIVDALYERGYWLWMRPDR